MKNIEMTALVKREGDTLRDARNDQDAQELFEHLMEYENKIKSLEKEKDEFINENKIASWGYKVVGCEKKYSPTEIRIKM